MAISAFSYIERIIPIPCKSRETPRKSFLRDKLPSVKEGVKQVVTFCICFLGHKLKQKICAFFSDGDVSKQITSGRKCQLMNLEAEIASLFVLKITECTLPVLIPCSTEFPTE